MTPEQERDPALRRSRYNHYRLPLIQTLLRCVYALEMLTVLRVWNVRRVLSQVLSGRGGKFRLLDLGCGLGDYIFLYAGTYPDALFLGVDAVEENVHLCRAYQHLRGLRNVAFVHDDLGRFVPDEKVDVVLCITVLQYVDDVSSALKNAHNALGEGGLLVLYQDVYDSVLGGPASSYPAHRMTSELQHTSWY